jgi:hypothetical protein
MHLIWENLIPNLVLFWSGNFKGLDQGTESYEIPNAVWDAIGEATAAAGSTIPSAYGSRVPNITKDQFQFSAEMWSFWTLYLGPVLLNRRFQRPKYYSHFVQLVCLLHICLRFEISDDEIEAIRVGFIEWVEEYESCVKVGLLTVLHMLIYNRLYYQHNADRLSTCPVTIHALLHIAGSIKATGPVWCYWAFPMERYCGTLRRAIRNRRFPSASLDRFVTESAQLAQIMHLYAIANDLSLRPPPGDTGEFSDPHCMSYLHFDPCTSPMFAHRSDMCISTPQIRE